MVQAELIYDLSAVKDVMLIAPAAKNNPLQGEILITKLDVRNWLVDTSIWREDNFEDIIAFLHNHFYTKSFRFQLCSTQTRR